MKKVLSAILACAILVGAMFTLVSCGGSLSGTYEGSICNLKFSGDDVTVSVEGVEQTVTGTYEIEEKDDGTKTISFDFIENEEGEYVLKIVETILGVDVPFEEKDDTITIAKYFTFTKK